MGIPFMCVLFVIGMTSHANELILVSKQAYIKMIID